MMKKVFTILSLACMLFAGSTIAQNFDNADFEQWNSSTSPKNWNSIGFMGMNLCDISRSNDAYSGQYALQLKGRVLPPTISATLNVPIKAIPGFITNATIDLSSLLGILGSIGNTENPSEMLENFDMETLRQLANVLTGGMQYGRDKAVEQIKGKYKFTPEGEQDMAILLALCVDVNGDNRDIKGIGLSFLEPAENYSDIDLGVMQMEAANELILLGITLNVDTNATSFGTLLLDDLSVVYGQLGIEETSSEIVSLYPNPCENKTFAISCQEPCDVNIYNTLGQKVMQINSYQPNALITLPSEGTYIVKYLDRVTKLIAK